MIKGRNNTDSTLIINNLPSFTTLRKLITLKMNNISSKDTTLLLSKFKNHTTNKPIMIQNLHLQSVDININAIKFINDYMVNLNHLQVDQIRITVNNSNDNIHITDLLNRLSSIHITTTNNTSSNGMNTLQPYFITRLLMVGNLKNCGKLYFCQEDMNINNVWGGWNNNQIISNPTNDIIATPERSCLESLHFHSSNARHSTMHKSHYQSLYHSIGKFIHLTKLSIDVDKDSADIISKMLSKCKILACLSLNMHQNCLMDPDEFMWRSSATTNNKQNIVIFNNLCDSIFVDNTNIKSIRIKCNEPRNNQYGRWNQSNEMKHTSSPLVVQLIKYVKKIKGWRKLDSFQYVSNKNVAKLFANSDKVFRWSFNDGHHITQPVENNDTEPIWREDVILSDEQRKIQNAEDIEELYLLDLMKEMVEKEIAITFTDINVSEFNNEDLRKLDTFCKSKDREYRIKMKEMNMTEELSRYYGQASLLITANIGIWDDRIQSDEKRLLEFVDYVSLDFLVLYEHRHRAQNGRAFYSFHSNFYSEMSSFM